MILRSFSRFLQRQNNHVQEVDRREYSSASAFEALERRELLSVALDAGVLTVTGSVDADRITIKPGGEDGVVVVMGDPDGDDGEYTGVDAVTVDGGEGNDRIRGKGKLTDTSGNNLSLTLIGGAGNDRLIGGPGNDTLVGDEGRDRINGRDGDDTIDGGPGNDRLNGGKGDDVIDGGTGHDRIHGSHGSDTLDGGNGDDRILGGQDDDTLTGGAGVDRLNGQKGTDTASYETSPAGVDVSLAEREAIEDGFGDSDRQIKGIENVDGSDFDDVIEGDRHDNILDGVAGIDELFGGNGNDTLVEHNAPIIEAALANDDGFSSIDGVTSDPTISGTVNDESPIVSFRAGFDSTDPDDFVDILIELQPDGSFMLTQAELEVINGEPLSGGSHTLHLQAEDVFGSLSDEFALDFLLFGGEGLVVTTTADTDDGSSEIDGLSLREAIALANSGDTIHIPAGIYTLTIGTLNIDKTVTILGEGPTDTIIQAAEAPEMPSFTVFLVEDTAPETVISGVTVRHAHIEGGNGVAIHTLSEVTIVDSVISHNYGNTGAAFMNRAPLTLINSTVSHNTATFTIIDNRRFTLTVINSTISNNTSPSSSGIRSFGDPSVGTARVLVQNSTIANNSGVAIRHDGSGGVFEIQNSILAGNSGGEATGSIVSLGYNIVGSTSGFSYTSGPGDIIGVDPLLGLLKDNGGPTPTHELLDGSPAINSGDPDFTTPPDTDQRGEPRVQGGRVDIGAFESAG